MCRLVEMSFSDRLSYSGKKTQLPIEEKGGTSLHCKIPEPGRDIDLCFKLKFIKVIRHVQWTPGPRCESSQLWKQKSEGAQAR